MYKSTESDGGRLVSTLAKVWSDIRQTGSSTEIILKEHHLYFGLVGTWSRPGISLLPP